MTQQEIIRRLLDRYDYTQTECDGMTRICHSLLSKHRIDHQPMLGAVSLHNQKVYPHFWIDLPSGERIDYRAKMWLGDNAPHGVFNSKDFPDVMYQGNPIELEVLSPTLFKILTLKIEC
ncbi:hypothetical protein SD80_012455 [Scytonema tolypothrichoides VB-61278]|nr:hypothetical protein SD80_012455 [Scytonema tolypothrichoides VB-61278]